MCQYLKKKYLYEKVFSIKTSARDSKLPYHCGIHDQKERSVLAAHSNYSQCVIHHGDMKSSMSLLLGGRRVLSSDI